jgi:hypothetical protein
LYGANMASTEAVSVMRSEIVGSVVPLEKPMDRFRILPVAAAAAASLATV